MVPITSERSLQQSMEALKLANAVRSERAKFKAECDRESVCGVLFDLPDWALTMKASDLLVLIRGVGRFRADKMLSRCRASSGKTIGALSARQRRELVALIEGYSR